MSIRHVVLTARWVLKRAGVAFNAEVENVGESERELQRRIASFRGCRLVLQEQRGWLSYNSECTGVGCGCEEANHRMAAERGHGSNAAKKAKEHHSER